MKLKIHLLQILGLEKDKQPSTILEVYGCVGDCWDYFGNSLVFLQKDYQ